jgi:hypothetical protein
MTDKRLIDVYHQSVPLAVLLADEPGTDAARAYLAGAWSPIPLPAWRKWPPPDGVTGWQGRYLTEAEVDEFDWTGNIALRLTHDVVGVDVDAYAGGLAGLAELVRRYGKLPPSPMNSTSRNDGSGIALYRLPPGTALAGAPAEGVQMVQWFHRYVVCAPSVHPDTGLSYRWLDRTSGEVYDDMTKLPYPAELPMLPQTWIDGLGVSKTGGAAAATPSEVRAFMAEHTTGEEWWALDAIVAKLDDEAPKSRHDALVRQLPWLAREVAAGWYPAEAALARAEEWWLQVTDEKRRAKDPSEFARAVLWAIGMAQADPTGVESKRRELAKRTVARVTEPRAPGGPVGRLAPQLDPAALHGILGDVVTTIRPHTEASDAALLVTAAVEVGNYIGRGPHVIVESDRHGCALFAVLVGESARARKGTAAGRIEALMRYVDPANVWSNGSIASGFGSGEGVIAMLDNGSRSDSRLIVDEREMAMLLTVASRDGSLLSSVLRNGWDGQPLRNRVKGGKLVATEYHLSALGHITRIELERLLTSTEQSNGFANRFLWVHTYRARRLPHGGALPGAVLAQLGHRLATAVQAARGLGLVTMTDPARRCWADIYDVIADGELPGIAAALTNRAEAQTLRLALLYAVLDGSPRIDVVHLEAAWALWRYCQASVLYIWPDATGDRDVDRLIDAVRRAEPVGLSVGEAYETVFGKHKAVGPIAARAVRYGLVRIEKVLTDGRPREVLHAV